MARYWFKYVSGGSGTPPILNPANYSLTSSKPKDFCEGSGVVCAVYALRSNQNKPLPFSSNLQTYISSAGSYAQPSSFGTKIFVYVKSS